MTPLLVFSHLRWNFVYQRPQHLLSRLATQRRVLFLEEPVPSDGPPRLVRSTPCPGVTVLCPHLPGAEPGFHDAHLPLLQPLLAATLAELGMLRHVQWFYTPMALPLAAGLAPRGIVYDCMDELSAFAQAPRQLLQREGALFRVADFVLTGGPSLYQAKRRRHAEVHCLPSSVDAAHFAQAAADHPSQAALPRPRLGYFGVVDERMDLPLLAALADARPRWQTVVVGPVAKIDPAALPRRPNLHWLGPRDYAELPAHLAGWDLCLLPFALNAATRYISPTKTLEYLAAGRPCVGTRIQDLAQPYADVVQIADDAPGFVAACERVLAWSPAQRAAFRAQARAHVGATSWDAAAARVHSLLARFEHARQDTAAAAPQRASAGG